MKTKQEIQSLIDTNPEQAFNYCNSYIEMDFSDNGMELSLESYDMKSARHMASQMGLTSGRTKLETLYRVRSALVGLREEARKAMDNETADVTADVPAVQTEANADKVLESLDSNNAKKREYTKAVKSDELLLASIFVATYEGNGNKSERSKAFLDTIKGFKYTDENTGKLISVFARFIDNGFLLRTTDSKVALRVAKQANKLMTTVSELQEDSGVQFGMSKSSVKKALAKGVEEFTELHSAIMERVEEFKLSNKGYYKA